MGPPYLPSMIGLTPGSYRSAAAKRLLHASTRMRGAHRAETPHQLPCGSRLARRSHRRTIQIDECDHSFRTVRKQLKLTRV